MSEIKNICKQVPIIPVLVIDDISKAKPWAKTLIEAGLHVLEVTLRTPCALEVIKIMSEVEGSIVGAGTVLNKKDVIIFDEPTSSLDKNARDVFLKNIDNLKENHIIIVITHDIELVKRLNSTVFCIESRG